MFARFVSVLPALFDGDRHRLFPKFQEKLRRRSKCKRLPLPRIRLIRSRPDLSREYSGMIRYIGKRPLPKKIDMSGDPACVEAHHGNALDESLVVSSRGGLANAFVYVKSGLEGKTFATPSTPVAIDQNGCWFRPRVLGIQTNQALQIYEIRSGHAQYSPMAQINREWNHSQGAGEPPLARKFAAGGHDPREVQYS